MKRLLIVGMTNSPHLHRWVRMIASPDLSIVLFPSIADLRPSSSEFRKIGLERVRRNLPAGVFEVRGKDGRDENSADEDAKWRYTPISHHFMSVENLASPHRLLQCIEQFQPDIIHSMETQIAGYLVSESLRRKPCDAVWIHSTWGSDIFLYGRIREHKRSLRETFSRVDIHLADCERDKALARAQGYTGPEMPIIPSSGGIDVDKLATLSTVQPSARRRILVKGYHNWAGRNLLALSAIVLAAQELQGYEIVVLAAEPDMQEWAGIMANRTGLNIVALDRHDEQEMVLHELAASRAVVSVGISDGLATTVLEAMTVGAFPIQSRAGCAADWFEDGVGGISVDVNNTRNIADAIIRVVKDDALVDRAAARNLKKIQEGWNRVHNCEVVREIYEKATETAAAR